ncbi:MAG: biotin/lipoyl-binding protein, partial [Acidimicrobiia bacterium]|nr:biotin/lipoyl-binding protein [Acidimicrobiia bacterium]
RRGVDELAAPLTSAADAEIHALAAALSDQAVRRSGAAVLGSIPSGWRNNPSQYQEVTFRRGEAEILVEYRLEAGAAEARLNGREVRAGHLTAAEDHVEMTVEGVHRRYTVSRAGGRHYVDSALGSTDFVEIDRFPAAAASVAEGSLTAPMPGMVRRLDVAVGDDVEAGDVLLVLEAMKMEHNVVAPTAGRVIELRAAAGEQVEAGRVLVVLGS